MRVWWYVFLVAIGGAIGSVLRLGVNELCRYWLMLKFGRVFPLGTLAVNILGGLLIGAFMALVRREQLSEEWRLLLVTGFLGGLTTFSAHSFETLMLAHEEAFGLALANVGKHRSQPSGRMDRLANVPRRLNQAFLYRLRVGSEIPCG